MGGSAVPGHLSCLGLHFSCKPLTGQAPTDSRPPPVSQKQVFDEGTPLPAQIQQLTKAGKSVSWEDNEVYLRACIILPVCAWCSSLDLVQLTPGKTELVCSMVL